MPITKHRRHTICANIPKPSQTTRLHHMSVNVMPCRCTKIISIHSLGGDRGEDHPKLNCSLLCLQQIFNPQKAVGPENIPGHVLREHEDQLTSPYRHLQHLPEPSSSLWVLQDNRHHLFAKKYNLHPA